MIISMGKVSQDTIFEEHGLQEVGKGLPRPAKAYNLTPRMPRPAPSQIDARCDGIKNDQIPPRRAIVRHEEKKLKIERRRSSGIPAGLLLRMR